MQHCNRVNKSFEKIPRFNGTNPAYCFDWLTQIEALVNDNKGRNNREELLFNCGISVIKTIQAIPQRTSHQEIKDAVLHNHLDLRTPHRDPMPTRTYTRSQMKCYKCTIQGTVVLLHCGCLSLNPFIELSKYKASISPKYESKSKTTSHCHLLLHDCTNAAV